MEGADRSRAGRTKGSPKGSGAGTGLVHAGDEPEAASVKPPLGGGPSAAGRARTDAAGARGQRAGEIAALVRLAGLDAGLLDRGKDVPAEGGVASERRVLAARLSQETLDAYERALRAGRKPAVVPVAESVCSGCHMRLHSKLDNQVRQRRGMAPCPYCLRLVYDPAWLVP
jgi:hypothetical protein